jgi:hypothetical protein
VSAPRNSIDTNAFMRQDALRVVLDNVRAEEARAIALLIEILTLLSSPGPHLDRACAIIEEWQHVPPARLVAALQSLRKELTH